MKYYSCIFDLPLGPFSLRTFFTRLAETHIPYIKYRLILLYLLIFFF